MTSPTFEQSKTELPEPLSKDDRELLAFGFVPDDEVEDQEEPEEEIEE
jgi:hypothetical protein